MKTWLVRIGILIGAVVGVIAAAVVALNLMSMNRQGQVYQVEVRAVPVPSDSAALARGRHLVSAVGSCLDCHGPDLGGRVMVDDPLFGRLSGSNLTAGKGGVGATFQDGDYVRTIRHGVAADGKSLIFMPSEAFQAFSDEDLGAIIAVIRRAAPVDREMPPHRIGPLARVLHVVAGLPLLPAERIDHQAARPGAPPEGVTAEYGEYLASASGCRACHGPQLAGGPGPNITRGAIGSWGEAGFARAVRQGTRPDGTKLSDEMPWKNFATMTDDEVAALWLFVGSVPEKAPKAK